ncbi:MAG: CheA signal transduction histidine kinase [Firmicutes bacterium]|nr:CheA signal transduction histidine kinase [Bacillota bacterium]
MTVKKAKNRLGNNPLQTALPGKSPMIAPLPPTPEGLGADTVGILVENLQNIAIKLTEMCSSQYTFQTIAEDLSDRRGLTKEVGALRAALAQNREAMAEIEQIIPQCLGQLGEESKQATRVNEEMLSVSLGNQVFLAPVQDIVEVFCLTGADMAVWGKKRVVCRRGEILPLFGLDELLETCGRARDPTPKRLYGMVVTGNSKIIIAVDTLLGKRSVAVQPLPQGLEFIRGISGAAMLGGEKIALVLDFHELFKLATKF